MSIHAITTTNIPRLLELCQELDRPASGLVYGNGTLAAPTQIEFNPDLSAPEIVILGRLQAAANRVWMWGDAEEQVFDTERVTLSAYHANANPTLAQSVAAIKSIIRVLNAMTKNS